MNSAKCIAAVMCMLCLLGACCRQRNSAAPVSDKTPATTAAESLLFIDSGTTPPQKPKYDYISDDGGLTFDLAALNERIHRQINAGEVSPWIYDYRYEEEYLSIFYGGPTMTTLIERYDTETGKSLYSQGYRASEYRIIDDSSITLLGWEGEGNRLFPYVMHIKDLWDAGSKRCEHMEREIYRCPLREDGYYTGDNFDIDPECPYAQNELRDVSLVYDGVNVLAHAVEGMVPPGSGTTALNMKTEYRPETHVFVLTVSGFSASRVEKIGAGLSPLIEEIQYKAVDEHTVEIAMKLHRDVKTYSLYSRGLALPIVPEPQLGATCYELRFYTLDTNFEK